MVTNLRFAVLEHAVALDDEAEHHLTHLDTARHERHRSGEFDVESE